jgi:YD repeat-containing protein
MIRSIFLCVTLCIAGALSADTVSYQYDDAGRLTSVTYPNGASISYTYDPAGNLTARTVTAPASAATDKPPAKKTASKRKTKLDDTVQKSK